MLKKIILLAGLLIMQSSIASLADKRQEILSQLIKIEKSVAEYQTKKFAVNDLSSEGGEIEIFYQKSIIKKIAMTILGETGKIQDTFYFDKGELFLCRSVEERYQLTADGQISDDKKISKQYYLFDNGDLIKPNAKTEASQQYIKKGADKRSLLLEVLAKTLIR